MLNSGMIKVELKISEICFIFQGVSSNDDQGRSYMQLGWINCRYDQL